MRFLAIAVAIAFAAFSAAKAEIQYQMIEGYGGVPLNVMTTGNPENPPILFIHGMAQASNVFRLQFESDLADDFYLVAFDMRGHGLSGKPWQPEMLQPSQPWAGDVAAVMAVTGIEKPVIVGWSYGGFVVSDYIRHYGLDNISGVNLVGSLGGLVPRSPFPQTEAAKRIMENSARTRSMNLFDNVRAAQNTAAGFYTDKMTQADRDAQVAMGIMIPAYVRRAFIGRDLDNTDIVEQITIPVLLTRGSDDLVMPANDTEVALERLPNPEFSFYEDTAHLPFFQHPERYNAELRAFAERVLDID